VKKRQRIKRRENLKKIFRLLWLPIVLSLPIAFVFYGSFSGQEAGHVGLFAVSRG